MLTRTEFTDKAYECSEFGNPTLSSGFEPYMHISQAEPCDSPNSIIEPGKTYKVVVLIQECE